MTATAEEFTFDVGGGSLPGRVEVVTEGERVDGTFHLKIVSPELQSRFERLTGRNTREFAIETSVYDYEPEEGDVVLVEADENQLPLIVSCKSGVRVFFDIESTHYYEFTDSKRPIYTYIPGFHIQSVPSSVRKPIVRFLQSVRSGQSEDVIEKYRKLPLTNFEVVLLLLQEGLKLGLETDERLVRWPGNKKAVFVALHDVDTPGFLKRKEQDLLFQTEEKHGIKATWFAPTGIANDTDTVSFLLDAGHEVGWHGHAHDHRLPFEPFADRRVEILGNSYLADRERFPIGMRTPKLLKSNHLYDLLDRNCEVLRYDTSFLRGILPYWLRAKGRQTRILEIPTTVPTDILLFGELGSVLGAKKFDMILETQIARTEMLIGVGGLISIVTHPEKDLSLKPELLEVYDQYLSYIKSRSDICVMTGGELYQFWTAGQSRKSRVTNAREEELTS